jgi:lysyl-tRNA synthetase class II
MPEINANIVNPFIKLTHNPTHFEVNFYLADIDTKKFFSLSQSSVPRIPQPVGSRQLASTNELRINVQFK